MEDKQFFWKDLSGRGFTNTFTEQELLNALPECEIMEDCDDCHGTGEREMTFLRGEEGMKIEVDAPVVCMWCEGKRQVLSDDSLSQWVAHADVGDEWKDNSNQVIRIS